MWRTSHALTRAQYARRGNLALTASLSSVNQLVCVNRTNLSQVVSSSRSSALLGQVTYLVASSTLDTVARSMLCRVHLHARDCFQLYLLRQHSPGGWAYAFHQDKASSVKVPVAIVTLFSSAHLLRENTYLFPVSATGVPVHPKDLPDLLSVGFLNDIFPEIRITIPTHKDSRFIDLTSDEDPIDEDRDTRVGDLEVSVSLGEILSGGRKSQESNIYGIIAGRAIIVRRVNSRPTGDRGIDNGFVSTVDAEARRQGISEVGYGIRDTWVDPVEADPEIAPTTLGEVSTRVLELAELYERDTQDMYALLEDAQDGRTRISQRVAMDSQRVDLLVGDRMTLQETV
ncbi:hypothetical protein Tco_1030226 [Tanacetum coccineum]|uniref:Uncharacterized protein n=1 Tax=Tanacetum coccineum TaxID=301880 RepID=A0ABQ5G5L7_9ASTR